MKIRVLGWIIGISAGVALITAGIILLGPEPGALLSSKQHASQDQVYGVDQVKDKGISTTGQVVMGTEKATQGKVPRTKLAAETLRAMEKAKERERESGKNERQSVGPSESLLRREIKNRQRTEITAKKIGHQV